MFDVVVACERSRGIGMNNHLPWRLSQDLKYFRELTRGDIADGAENCVIMGRNTWQSIPIKHRPLPGRHNIILTRHVEELRRTCGENGSVAGSFDEALDLAHRTSDQTRCFVIGGAKVYEQALHHKSCDRLYLTQIDAQFECDVFFPRFEEEFLLLSESEVQEENGVPFSFKVYRRK